MKPSEIEALEIRLARINHHRREPGLAKGAQLLERAVEEMFHSSGHLAVYGSLAPGKGNHHVVSHLNGSWSKAQVFGDLLDQGWGAGLGFPAMRWRPSGEPIEVDLIESPEIPEVWGDIDRFEGSGYARILVPFYVGGSFVGVTNIYELAPEPTVAAVESEPILTTPRLDLREMNLGDLDYLASLLGDPEVMRYFPNPLTREESAAWIHRQLERYKQDGCGYWLVIERSSQQPVGQIGVLMTEIDGQKEPALGYIVDAAFWRRRVASEAAAACIEWVFAQTDQPRVITLVRPENIPSLAVARKIGMVEQGQTLFAGYEHKVFSIDRASREPSPAE